jgi:hypothetical protein
MLCLLVREHGPKMADKSYAREYVAALCHMRDRALVPYDTVRFVAANRAKAAARARKWAMANVGVTTNKTWLNVTLDGVDIYNEELRSQNAPRSPRQNAD